MGEIAGDQQQVRLDRLLLLIVEAPHVRQQMGEHRLERVVHGQRSETAERVIPPEPKVGQMEDRDRPAGLSRRQRLSPPLPTCPVHSARTSSKGLRRSMPSGCSVRNFSKSYQVRGRVGSGPSWRPQKQRVRYANERTEDGPEPLDGRLVVLPDRNEVGEDTNEVFPDSPEPLERRPEVSPDTNEVGADSPEVFPDGPGVLPDRNEVLPDSGGEVLADTELPCPGGAFRWERRLPAGRVGRADRAARITALPAALTCGNCRSGLRTQGVALG